MYVLYTSMISFLRNLLFHIQLEKKNFYKIKISIKILFQDNTNILSWKSQEI